jgi:multicomponent Na+:H+ antiporter subunit B
MTSLILATATRVIFPLLLLLSVFLLVRGHNEPGGGFIGALVAVAAFTLDALAYGVATARRALRVDPHTLVGAGLLLALVSALAGPLGGEPIMTARWIVIDAPPLGAVALGTPLLFDAGVYLTVIGVMLMIIFTLSDE